MTLWAVAEVACPPACVLFAFSPGFTCPFVSGTWCLGVFFKQNQPSAFGYLGCYVSIFFTSLCLGVVQAIYDIFHLFVNCLCAVLLSMRGEDDKQRAVLINFEALTDMVLPQ